MTLDEFIIFFFSLVVYILWSYLDYGRRREVRKTVLVRHLCRYFHYVQIVTDVLVAFGYSLSPK